MTQKLFRTRLLTDWTRYNFRPYVVDKWQRLLSRSNRQHEWCRVIQQLHCV